MQTITLGGNSYNLVARPAHPGPASVEIGMNDVVAVVTSPFTRQEQAQTWPGGDYWDATVTLPPMLAVTAAPWRGFLAELRGRGNVLQIFDPSAMKPGAGAVGAPVVHTTGGNNLPMTTTLTTTGWTASMAKVLKRGQQFQVGYRLYMACEDVDADSGGNASVSVWPSLRETPADATAIVLALPQGLFRLSSNRRAVEWSPGRLTTLSFKCVEAGR